MSKPNKVQYYAKRKNTLHVMKVVNTRSEAEKTKTELLKEYPIVRIFSFRTGPKTKRNYSYSVYAYTRGVE